MKLFPYMAAVSILCCLCSCSEKPDGPEAIRPSGGYEVIRMADPEFIFGFEGQDKYSYCPSAILHEDGSVDMFFCGNPDNQIMVDNIWHVRIGQSGDVSEARSVLQPGTSGSWDDHHTCDPSVIEGEFRWGDETFRYAMFFLGNRYGVYYNEIGVAFSNDLASGSWKKYPEQLVCKTWQADGDQVIGTGVYSWGVGQPSAVSLDGKGKVLLTYTTGDMSGTRVVWREADMSDVENIDMTPPRTIVQAGLYGVDGKSRDYTCNADFAVNMEEDKILMIRPVQPHPADYPSYIPVAQEIDCMNLSDFRMSKGEWTPVYRIMPSDTGFPRNHNSCLLRDSYGYIRDWENPVFYYTVSKAAPDVQASGSMHAEWTYHIYKSSLFRETI